LQKVTDLNKEIAVVREREREIEREREAQIADLGVQVVGI
jgi:hypothetical protein